MTINSSDDKGGSEYSMYCQRQRAMKHGSAIECKLEKEGILRLIFSKDFTASDKVTLFLGEYLFPVPSYGDRKEKEFFVFAHSECYLLQNKAVAL